MENNSFDPSSSTPERPAKYILFASLLGAGAAWFPIALTVFPAYLAFAMTATNRRWLPAYLVSYTVMTTALYVPVETVSFGKLLLAVVPALSLVACAALLALVIQVLQEHRLGNANTVAAGAAAAIATLYAAVCLPGILSGEGAFTELQTMYDTWLAAVREATLQQAAGQGEETIARVQEVLSAFDLSVATVIVPGICGVGILLSLINLLVFRRFLKGGKRPLPPMQPFRLWSIPRNYTTGIIVLLLGALILGFTGADYAEGVTLTVNALVGVPLGLQGLCFVDYLNVRRGGNVRLRRWIVFPLFGLTLLLPYASATLMYIGCFEQLFRYRARLENAGRTPPEKPQ